MSRPLVLGMFKDEAVWVDQRDDGGYSFGVSIGSSGGCGGAS